MKLVIFSTIALTGSYADSRAFNKSVFNQVKPHMVGCIADFKPRKFILANACEGGQSEFNGQCYNDCKQNYLTNMDDPRFCETECPEEFVTKDYTCEKPAPYKPIDFVGCYKDNSVLVHDQCEYICPDWMIDDGDFCLRRMYKREPVANKCRSGFLDNAFDYQDGLCYRNCQEDDYIGAGANCIYQKCPDFHYNCGGLVCLRSDQICTDNLMHWSFEAYESYNKLVTGNYPAGGEDQLETNFLEFLSVYKPCNFTKEEPTTNSIANPNYDYEKESAEAQKVNNDAADLNIEDIEGMSEVNQDVIDPSKSLADEISTNPFDYINLVNEQAIKEEEPAQEQNNKPQHKVIDGLNL